jgi:hypothetical protein
MKYIFRYGRVKPSELSNRVWVPGRGFRQLHPLTCIYRKLERETQFYTKLEESILAEGVRNPIFANAFDGETYCSYGASRLWIAAKHDIELPIIIADYDGQWNNFKRLTTHKQIKELFDMPIWIHKTEEGVTLLPAAP